MEDLLASIRKIIADESADRPRAAVRVTPPLHREPPLSSRQPDVDPDIAAMVERSMLDAFGIVDAEPEEPRSPQRVVVDGGAKDDPGIEAAVHSIAEAIAAERQGRSRRPGPVPEPCDWSGDVPGEPGLDGEHAQRPTLWPAVAASPLPERAAARAASLRARYEAPARAEPANPAASAARAVPNPGGPLPPNVYRLEPGERAPDMTDAAVDPTSQDWDGKVFRQKAAGRAEHDDGLTSARTRRSVSSQLDQLSRTVITNNPRTLEDVVRDMIRPLLREWLEANLPDIVERQVRHEIDRVSGRGG